MIETKTSLRKKLLDYSRNYLVNRLKKIKGSIMITVCVKWLLVNLFSPKTTIAS
jgi:hypothetical protein